MSRMPEDVRRKIIADLYRRADALDWDGLPPADRSAWYSRWLEDPDIGGVLDTYMARDQARLWIKDTPMKHYNRARSGIGPYANLASSRLPDAPTLARLAFGQDWGVVSNTLRDKPNRCVITDGTRQVEMIWGPPRAVQSLMWAAMNAVVDQTGESTILIVTRQGERLSDGEMSRHRRMGELLRVPVHHLTVNTQTGDAGTVAP